MNDRNVFGMALCESKMRKNDTNQNDLARDGYKLGSHGNKLGISLSGSHVAVQIEFSGLSDRVLKSSHTKRFEPESDQLS